MDAAKAEAAKKSAEIKELRYVCMHTTRLVSFSPCVGFEKASERAAHAVTICSPRTRPAGRPAWIFLPFEA